jgi:hypothetical protein
MKSCLIFSGVVDTEGDSCDLWTVAAYAALDVDAFCLVLRSVMRGTQIRLYLEHRLSYLNSLGRLFFE